MPALKEKRAQLIAEQMEAEILSKPFEVGELFGTEADLTNAYSVSSSVFREAVAIAEQDGLLRMRRGRNGGLFVAQPPEFTAITSACNYMEFADVSCREILELRKILEFHILKETINNLESDDYLEIKRLYDASSQVDLEPASFHFDYLRTMCRIYGNPIIQNMTITLTTLCNRYLALQTTNLDEKEVWMSKVTDERVNILKGFLTLDHELCFASFFRFFDLLSEQFTGNMHSGWSKQQSKESIIQSILALKKLQGDTQPPKLAEATAFRIWNYIKRQNLAPGDALGQEPELLEQLGVGRGVLREAIRILEGHRLVKMKRGNCGGLKVSRPAPHAAIRSATLFYRSINVKVEDITIAGNLGATAWVEFAARRYEQRKHLVQDIEPLGNAYELFNMQKMMFSFYLWIGRLADNRIMHFFSNIMVNLYRIDETKFTNDPDMQNLIISKYQKVIDAVQQNNPALARACLQEAQNTIPPHGIYLQGLKGTQEIETRGY